MFLIYYIIVVFGGLEFAIYIPICSRVTFVLVHVVPAAINVDCSWHVHCVTVSVMPQHLHCAMAVGTMSWRPALCHADLFAA